MNQLQFSTLQANLTCNGLVINVNNVGGGGNGGPGFENLGGGAGLGGGVGGGGLGGNVGGFGGGGEGFVGAGGFGAISALNLILQAQTLILNINNHGAPFQWPAQDGGAQVDLGPGPAPFPWPAQDGGAPVDLGPGPAPVEAPAPLNAQFDLDPIENIIADNIDWEAFDFDVMLGQLNNQGAPNGEQPDPEDNSDIID